MKKIFSLIFTALLIISILSALNIAHSPEVQGQFVVDNYTLALWHFNEGEGQVVHDESPHHNDGTLGSTLNAEDRDPSWVSGFTDSSGDYALSFDQWYDYAIAPDNPDGSLDLQLLPQFTIEFYAYSRQISRADRGNGQHWNRFLQKEFVTGDVNRAEDITGYGAEQSSYPQPTALLGFDMPNYGKGLGFSCLPPPLNEWVLVTIVYKKDNYCSIYFNCVLQLQTFVENVNFTDNAAPLTIGKWIGWDYPWLDAIDGIIDEVRLSSIARITEQGQFVVDDYTLALWHLNEGEGQVVHDESVHHNDGTLGGTSNVEDADPSWVGGFTGEPGDYALSFDDWYDYANIPDNSDGSLDVQLLDQFTIEFWTNLRQVSRSDRGDGTHWNRFLEKGYIAYGPPDICGYGIYQCLGYNSLSAWVQDYGTENWQIECSPTPPLSTWVLVSLVYDGNYARIYFNNVMQSEREVGWINFTDTTAPLTLGKWPGEDWPWADSIDGIIDEVRFSNIARNISVTGPPAWDVFYSADKLPDESEPPWELGENFEGIAANVSNGVLTIDTISESRYWNYRRSWNANNSIGVTVEANLTVLNASIYGELEINIADGTHATALTFFEDRISLFNVGDYLMNVDRFHIYRIVARENDIFLYVDGELVLNGTGKFTYNTPGEYRVMFGDAKTGSNETSGGVSEWNYFAYTIKGAFPSPPDLTVTEVKPSKTVVCQGYSLKINVTVTNYGSETETFNITVYYNQTAIMIEQWPNGANSQIFWSMGDVNRDGYIDGWDHFIITQAFGADAYNPKWNPNADINSDGRVEGKDLGIFGKNYGKDIWRALEIPKLIENQRAVTLLGGNSATITIRWNTTGVVKGNYTIGAHAWPVLGETDTADNTYFDGAIVVVMVGDINSDGKVNILDISSAAKSFGSAPWETRWDSNTDVNGDGYINIVDLAIIAKEFGKTDP